MSSPTPHHHRAFPTLSTQATAVVSVAMVLLILGIVAILALAARRVGREVRENVGYAVVVSDSASKSDLHSLRRLIEDAPSTSTASFATPDEVLANWQQMIAADSTSEEEGDIVEMLGVNPFSAEWNVHVHEDYASTDSLAKITAQLRRHPAVTEIVIHQEMIDSINSTLNTLTVALLIVAAALLLISMALINNTVRLSVYARRFTIHTMQLVGATAPFIRRPFVRANIIGGIIAALLAFVILVLMICYSRTIDPIVTEYVTPQSIGFIGIGMFAAGTVICGLAATFAANKYIRTSYDDLFDS